MEVIAKLGIEQLERETCGCIFHESRARVEYKKIKFKARLARKSTEYYIKTHNLEKYRCTCWWNK